MAKKFKLAALLRVRRIMEDKKKREFGDALREWIAATRERDEINRQIEAAQQAYNEHAVGGITIDELRLRETHLMTLRQNLLMQEVVILQAAQKRDWVREELIEATRRRQVVEKLKEKFTIRVNYEANKQAEKQLAETALLRFARQAAERESGQS